MWKPYKIKEIIKITEMFSLFTQHYDKGYSYPGETHDFWECVCVMNGNLCVSADERVYNLSSNEMIFHKPLELHKFSVNSEQGADLLIFSFSLNGKIADFFTDKVFSLSIDQADIISSFAEYVENFQNNHQHKYVSIVKKFSGDTILSQLVTTYIYRLFLSLYDENNISKHSVSQDALIFNNAVKYMKMHIHSQLTIDELSKYCHISPTGIKRVFKKYSGLGVHKYFLKLKITAASSTLKNGTNVTDTARIYGFSDQSYFSSAFKRETGISPSEYKLNHSAD